VRASEEILSVSEEVASSTEEYDVYTPADGETVIIQEFYGEGAFTQNSAVCLKWNYNTSTGAYDDLLWSVKGASKMGESKTVVGDGTKKLAVTCDNGEDGAVMMTAYARLRCLK